MYVLLEKQKYFVSGLKIPVRLLRSVYIDCVKY